jgi:HAD superfamily hydrolase (TIGR01509 family)
VREAVIFDLDGVLIDSEGLQYAAYAQVLARFGVRVSTAEYAEHWIAAGEGPEYAVRTYALPLAPDALRALKDPVYIDILRRAVTLMPGARAALDRLGRRWPLAVATNSKRVEAAFVLEHFGIADRFAAVVTREDYACAKPAPDAYETAAARLGSTPAACVVVEDAARGVLAATRAGAVVVAVPNAFTAQSDLSAAAAVVGSLDELTVDTVERLLVVHRRR